MGYSKAGKIFAGTVSVYIIFVILSYIIMLINPELFTAELVKRGVEAGTPESSVYFNFTVIEIIRLLISLGGLILIILGNRNGPSVYLGSTLVGILMLLLRKNYSAAFTEILIAAVLLILLFYSDVMRERFLSGRNKHSGE